MIKNRNKKLKIKSIAFKKILNNQAFKYVNGELSFDECCDYLELQALECKENLTPNQLEDFLGNRINYFEVIRNKAHKVISPKDNLKAKKPYSDSEKAHYLKTTPDICVNNPGNDNGKSMLCAAIERENVLTVDQLFKMGADVNYEFMREYFGGKKVFLTPLKIAIQKENVDIIGKLINYNVDVEANVAMGGLNAYDYCLKNDFQEGAFLFKSLEDHKELKNVLSQNKKVSPGIKRTKL